MLTPVLSKLTQTDGILIACGGERGAIQFNFDASLSEEERKRFQELLQTMADLLEVVPASQEDLKMILTTESLVLRRSRGVYVGVVAVKSHPVVKSLQRMLRRSFKKLGAPIADSRPRVPARELQSAVPQAVETAPTRPIDVAPPTPPSNEDDNSGPPPAF